MKHNLEKIAANFSKKQKLIYEKINAIVGSEVAIALISMQGVSSTSQQEIVFVANLISEFAPFKISSFSESPRALTLEAKVQGRYRLLVYPQYTVIQPDTCRTNRSKPWSVDVVLELFAEINGIEHQIGIVGYEYDGHVSHYVQNGVLESYKRDAGVMQEVGFNPVRVSPDSWKSNPKHYIESLKKYIRRSILKFEKIQSNTIKAALNQNGDYDDLYEAPVTCKLCNGRGKFGGQDCEPCRGMGSLSKYENDSIYLDKFEINTCPECRNGATSCDACHGTGTLSREQMLALN